MSNSHYHEPGLLNASRMILSAQKFPATSTQGACVREKQIILSLPSEEATALFLCDFVTK